MLLAGPLAGCSGDQPSGIEVGKVGRSTVTEVVEAPANVIARAAVTLTAPADGRVARLRVRDGQHVRAGQVLMRISSASAHAALRRARKADDKAASAGAVYLPGADLTGVVSSADGAAAEAFAAARKAALRIPAGRLRDAALARERASEAQYAAARAQAQDAADRFNAGLGSLGGALGSLAGAQRVQTRAVVAAARRTVHALAVRAPIAGVVALGTGTGGSGGSSLGGLVGSLPQAQQDQASALLGAAGSGTGGSAGGGDAGSPVTRGSPVSAGAPVATLTDVSTLSLRAEVDETDVLLVRRGVRADVDLDALPGARYAAHVVSVAVAPTTSARGGVSYVVRLALGAGRTAAGAPAPRPRPGMSAVAALRVRTATNAVSVPASAVVRDGTRDTVWLVRSGRAERRQVRLGAQGDTTVQVLRGLGPGDEVVIHGADKVAQGQQVP